MYRIFNHFTQKEIRYLDSNIQNDEVIITDIHT